MANVSKCSGTNNHATRSPITLAGRFFGFIWVLLLPLGAAAQSAQWDLGDLYASPEAWSAAYERSQATVAKLDRFKGSLGKNPESLLAALGAISDARREALRLLGYAFLRCDEDVRDAPNAERRQNAQLLLTQLSDKTAWVTPEVQRLGNARLRDFISRAPELKRRFDFFLLDTL